MTKKVNLPTDSECYVSDVNQAVSQRIKSFRRQKKMSLDELSRRAGVSKGMLVDIEGCKANPSIALLCRIAAAMGISVADIVDVATAPAVHMIDAAAIPCLWRGEQGGSAHLLAGTSGPDMLEMWRWVMHPGETFTSEGHPEGTTEILYVESGELTLTVNQERFQLAAGSSAIAKTDMPHAYGNQSHGITVFMMTVNEKAR